MATLTDAEICNVALARVGQREFIDDLNDASAQAQVCKALFTAARDAVLESFAWPFATRRATLALLAGATRDSWGYVYVLPSDCVAVRYVYAGTRNPASDERIAYAREIADDANGNPTVHVLLTDQIDAVLVYTALISVTALYPPLFVDALAWRLAADLALALPVKPEVGLRMQQGYSLALNRAAASQLKQQQLDVPPDSEFVRIR